MRHHHRLTAAFLLAVTAAAALAACTRAPDPEPLPSPTPAVAVATSRPSRTPSPSPTPPEGAPFGWQPDWTEDQVAAASLIDEYAAYVDEVAQDPAHNSGELWARFTTGAEYDRISDWQLAMINQGIHFEGPMVLQWRSVDPESISDTGDRQIRIVQCEDYSAQDLIAPDGQVAQFESEVQSTLIMRWSYLIQWIEAVNDWRVGYAEGRELC
ncbi:MAG: hypothetical protein LBH76_09610 [Propionibacteriaceae bacterium]|jgi:hypothetical protein|nr:hypothetical protein [Propionibacteriaceae bacterium]